jgi:hypothetical protein
MRSPVGWAADHERLICRSAVSLVTTGPSKVDPAAVSSSIIADIRKPECGSGSRAVI